MATFSIPVSAELEEITQSLIPDYSGANFYTSNLMPVQSHDTEELLVRIEDNYYGMQAFAGLGGTAAIVNPVGETVYYFQPGVYRDERRLEEGELTRRAKDFQNLGVPVDIAVLIGKAAKLNLTRMFNRIRYNCRAVVTGGTLYGTTPDGKTTIQIANYSVQVFTPSVPWNTLATATPLADLTILQSQFGWGTSNMFAAPAMAFANTKTWRNVLLNQNANDIFGKKDQFGATLNDLGSMGKIFAYQDGPIPVVVDTGWEDDNQQWQLDIPTGQVIVVGQRPTGEKPGQYMMTRNMVNGGAPGPYMKVYDTMSDGPTQAKPGEQHISHCCGHNGGPAYSRPTQVVVIQAF